MKKVNINIIPENEKYNHMKKWVYNNEYNLTPETPLWNEDNILEEDENELELNWSERD